MKRISLIFVLLSFCSLINAQKFIQIRDKAFNFGAKVGFNSTFPIINSFTIDGVDAQNVRLQYKVGYLASVFCRVNIDRFFMQPSLEWHHTASEVRFTLPGENADEGNAGFNPGITFDRLNLKTSSLEVPILIGYNLVKEAPYALSMMVGPKLKYNYKVSYSSDFRNSPWKYTDDSTPFGINMVAGISVSIWRLFFDFSYEFGLHNTHSDFKNKNPEASDDVNMQISKRTNMMSFSLGFLF